jgi:hypothetical protein
LCDRERLLRSGARFAGKAMVTEARPPWHLGGREGHAGARTGVRRSGTVRAVHDQQARQASRLRGQDGNAGEATLHCCRAYQEAEKEEALPTFFDFLAEHWNHLRISNPIESGFATVRRRTVQTKEALSAKTAKLMAFKLVNPLLCY